MPWRVIAHGGQVWHVDAIAERRPNTEAWQLALSFRVAGLERTRGPGPAGEGGGAERRRVWTLYPLEATSKSSLYIQAERIPDDALSQVLAEHLR
ncbi:MAG TPA: hypothetical protein VNI61_01245 [Gemmatimonadales bacterium]|nr:hypothetical protein [Gemmatimonadales bacterium]